MKQSVIITHHLETALTEALSEVEHDRLFVVADTTTAELCWPLIKDYRSLADAQLITIGATEENKTLDSVVNIWQALQQGGATRHSCVINLGGGMVTDLSGFAASTFKRGINFIHIPTTLLSMVDASVGGKTGFNFGGLKNEIGVFKEARFVLMDTRFLQSLDWQNLLSGYAEMLKHGLISDRTHWEELLTFDWSKPDWEKLSLLLARSVEVKEEVVTKDPYENGLRKALNLGHTVGHALESLSLDEAGKRNGFPMLHGYAVAYGLVAELFLASIRLGFPTELLHPTVKFILDHYGRPAIDCDDYDRLIELMRHDKKNTRGIINFTYLKDIGDIHVNQTASDEEIRDALDFLCGV